MKSLFILSSAIFIFCCFSSLVSAQQSSYPGTNIGIEFWKLAQISYCSASDISNWNTSCSYISEFSGMESINVITGGSNQAFSAYYPTDNQIYVVFRGSSNLPNWIEDLNTFYSQYDYSLCSGCKVHSGFYDAYNSLASGVKNNVDALQSSYSGAGLSIIGHSLGGAEATLAVADLIDQGYTINYFMTFGSPRVGNPAFSNWFDGSMNLGTYSSRVVHNKDIVPHLPPMSFGFQHINTEVWYTSDSNNDFQICTQNEDPNCSIQYNLLECSTSDHTSYFNLQDTMLHIPPIKMDGVTINQVAYI